MGSSFAKQRVHLGITDGVNSWEIRISYHSMYGEVMVCEDDSGSDSIHDTELYTGQFRLQRVGSEIRGSYKKDDEADFHWGGDSYYTFGSSSEDDMQIIVKFSYDGYSTAYDFDVYVWDLYNVDDTFRISSSSFFSFENVSTEEQYNFVICADDTPMLEEENINVRDSCGSDVSHKIVCCDPIPCCTDPDYSFSYSGENPLEVDLSWERVEVDGGCPPYHWESDNTNYVFAREWTNAPNNRIRKYGESPGAATLTITDGCDSVVTIDVLGCCEDPAYSFSFDPTNDYLFTGDNDTKEFSILGGCEPFIWETTTCKNGRFTTKTSVTSGRTNFITGNGYCYGSIRVTDACGSIYELWNAAFTGCESEYYSEPEQSIHSASVIGQDATVSISVSHGKSPFSWALDINPGGDFTLDDPSAEGRDNTLTSSPTACGTPSVSVTDICGNVVYLAPRCTANSHWSHRGGVSADPGGSGDGWDCECGDYWGYTGCHTFNGKDWLDPDKFENYCGPLCDYSDQLYFTGITGDLYWAIGEGNLVNPCNIDHGDCENTPFDWVWEEDGNVEGYLPLGESPAYWSEVLQPIVVGIYHDNDCGFGFT